MLEYIKLSTIKKYILNHSKSLKLIYYHNYFIKSIYDGESRWVDEENLEFISEYEIDAKKYNL